MGSVFSCSIGCALCGSLKSEVFSRKACIVDPIDQTSYIEFTSNCFVIQSVEGVDAYS
jgi:hypothetical protein